MILFPSKEFKKSLDKLPQEIRAKFDYRLRLFLEDPFNPLLKNHALKGKLFGFRAFSITGNYRVVYQIIDSETIELTDIGTHNQIY